MISCNDRAEEPETHDFTSRRAQVARGNDAAASFVRPFCSSKSDPFPPSRFRESPVSRSTRSATSSSATIAPRSFSGQQQSVAEVNSSGFLSNASVFGTTGGRVSRHLDQRSGRRTSLPTLTNSGDILELQPNGQLFVFNPTGGTSSQYDNLPNYTANASNVFDVQTGASVNLSSQISLTGATYGDFGVYNNSLVISAESNNWDFVMRLTYGSSGGAATVLVASPASDGLSASPEGVAVDSQGTVLTTLPYVPAGSTTAIHVPVGFSLFYDTGSSPAPIDPEARSDERPQHRHRRNHG